MLSSVGFTPRILTGKWNHRYPFYFQGWQDQWEAGERDSWIRQRHVHNIVPPYFAFPFLLHPGRYSFRMIRQQMSDIKDACQKLDGEKVKAVKMQKNREKNQSDMRTNVVTSCSWCSKSGPGRGKPVKEMADNSRNMICLWHGKKQFALRIKKRMQSW